jgi:hypothetical protein
VVLPTALLPNSATVRVDRTGDDLRQAGLERVEQPVRGMAQRRVDHRTETGKQRQPVIVNGASS